MCVCVFVYTAVCVCARMWCVCSPFCVVVQTKTPWIQLVLNTVIVNPPPPPLPPPFSFRYTFAVIGVQIFGDLRLTEIATGAVTPSTTASGGGGGAGGVGGGMGGVGGVSAGTITTSTGGVTPTPGVCEPKPLAERASFHQLDNAMLVLFQVFVGNNWNDVMYPIRDATGRIFLAPIFFCSYYFLCTTILANLVTGIIIEGFHAARERRLLLSNHSGDEFEDTYVQRWKREEEKRRVDHYVVLYGGGGGV